MSNANRERTLTTELLCGRGAHRRDGAPEPTLLPHLARWAPLQSFDFVCHLADGFGGGRFVPQLPWPALADATFAAVAERVDASRPLEPLLARHPRLASFVADAQLPRVTDVVRLGSADCDGRAVELQVRLAARRQGSDDGEAADAARLALAGQRGEPSSSLLCRLALAVPDAERASLLARLLSWPELDLGGVSALLPALAEDDQLRLVERHARLVLANRGPAERLALRAYLLPCTSGAARAWLLDGLRRARTERGALAGLPGWYAALVVARLGGSGVDWLVGWSAVLAGQLDAPWRRQLTRRRAGADPPAPYADVLRVHPGSDDPETPDALARLERTEVDALLDATIGRWGGAGSSAVGDDVATGTWPVDDDFDATERTVLRPPPQPTRPSSTFPPQPTRPTGAAPPQARRQSMWATARRATGQLWRTIAGRREEDEAAAPVDDAAAPPATAAQPRRLQARVELREGGDRYRELRHAFVAGREHRVGISVGSTGPIRADRDFSEPEFAAGQDFVALDVRFIHRDVTACATLMLPRQPGAESTSAPFALSVPADASDVHVFVVVLHEGRILQAALLHGAVVADAAAEQAAGGAFGLSVQAWVHELGNLDGRSTFDASVLAVDEIGAAAFAGVAIGVGDLAGIDATVAEIGAELFGAARAAAHTGQAIDGDDAAELLRWLANKGQSLHTALVRQLMPELEQARRIQIVTTNASSYLPLEFVYGGPTPTDDARLCAGWRQALRDGRCAACAAQPAAGGRVRTICPLGFWGLSKVIERHAVPRERQAGYSFLVRAESLGSRPPLRPLQRVLFGASAEVPEADVEATAALLRRVAGSAEEVQSWPDWRRRIDTAPSLLVGMPHNLPSARFKVLELHLARGPGLRVGEVTEAFVRPGGDGAVGPGPVVLLLGCKTALAEPHPFLTFVGAFRISGASVVVGTFATVLAEDSPVIVRAFVGALAERLRQPAERPLAVGDVLLDVRRRMFADGLVVALGMAAFGDADWVLGA